MTKKNHSLTNTMEKNTSTRIIVNHTIKKRSMTTKSSQNTPNNTSMIILMNKSTTSTRTRSITNTSMMIKNTRSTTLKNTWARTGKAIHTSHDTHTTRKICTKVMRKLKRLKSEENCKNE